MNWIYKSFYNNIIYGPARNIPLDVKISDVSPDMITVTQKDILNAKKTLTAVGYIERPTDFRPKEGVLGELSRFFKEEKSLRKCVRNA
jgi:hypothetical protein